MTEALTYHCVFDQNNKIVEAYAALQEGKVTTPVLTTSQEWADFQESLKTVFQQDNPNG